MYSSVLLDVKGGDDAAHTLGVSSTERLRTERLTSWALRCSSQSERKQTWEQYDRVQLEHFIVHPAALHTAHVRETFFSMNMFLLRSVQYNSTCFFSLRFSRFLDNVTIDQRMLQHVAEGSDVCSHPNNYPRDHRVHRRDGLWARTYRFVIPQTL